TANRFAGQSHPRMRQYRGNGEVNHKGTKSTRKKSLWSSVLLLCVLCAFVVNSFFSLGLPQNGKGSSIVDRFRGAREVTACGFASTPRPPCPRWAGKSSW